MRFRKNFRFVFTSFLLTLALVCFYLYIFTKSNEYQPPTLTNSPIYCYQNTPTSNALPSILQAKVPKDQSIFFVDTSCNSAKVGKIFTTPRQACAVESAARLNPNLKIHLLYTSPGTIKNQGTQSDRLLEVLQSYENVKIYNLDFGEYVKGTPVEDLWRKGTLGKSYYVLWHASDVIRFVTLWRYGGIYLDLDVIVKKSLEDLPLNYAGVEGEASLCSAVISFGRSKVGRALSTRCLEDLNQSFDGEMWAHNGPGVITRLVKTVCGSGNISDFVGKTCEGFKIYPIDTFYAVPGDNWTMFFKEDFVDEVMEMTRDSHVVYFWNDVSYKEKVPVGKRVPYTVLAEEYCPNVYTQCDDFFLML